MRCGLIAITSDSRLGAMRCGLDYSLKTSPTLTLRSSSHASGELLGAEWRAGADVYPACVVRVARLAMSRLPDGEKRIPGSTRCPCRPHT